MACSPLKTALSALFLVGWPLGAQAAEPATYTLAVVPQFDLRRIEAVWRPIVDHLQSATGARFTLVTETTIPVFEKGLHGGAYDFAYMNPYHYVVVHQRQGYKPLVRDVEDKLSGIVVVRKDSGLTDARMLDGRKVAFPAPNAMGAALIPRAEFSRKLGIRITEVYVKSHGSAYLNVMMGQADAAGGIRATFDQQKPELRDGLAVIYETEQYTPHPLAAHPRVPAEMAEKVQQAMIALGTTPMGDALLDGIPIKTIGIARDSDYDALRNLGLEAFYVEQ
ncbi:ABC-type phosphate/phosphonate transport system [Magnetospirillum sp. XM-1]|uniref:phosphate/phosphite/phosphonate ABC transporter substrate-binding protein n=1 Tax=Magnetospirillum sp. XM-1 TaxID=1663591 RepID=UPI00073DE74A|nr:phosphate/phosphite/phosphonate ABC transporter substrate-binding protein [Magnetospirillum sp. XM-1]CUW41073.1 ABC-type phosphate/phosphonate transport system [Magnetospirillum sp. XM-1]